jgi:tetrathionate reductase subunit B
MEKDILTIMQEDLARALAKPAEKRRWAMLIDTRKCVGCHACTIGCVSENKLPPKLYYRPVLEYERGNFPKVSLTFLPKPCMQCDKPPCVAACPEKGPEGATWKETSGVGAGIVAMDYGKCIGCGKCVPACPYGARAMDNGSFHTGGNRQVQAYETLPMFEYGRRVERKEKQPPIGKARKCHFCMHRLANGMLPQCITTCIGRAGYFGDENDSKSLLYKVKKSADVQVLRKKQGTAPRVYYIGREKLEVLHG